MKRLYLFFHLTLCFFNISAQSFQWAKNEGLWAYDYGYGIITDSAGNVYVSGKYELEANFSGITLPFQGNHDVYLAQYSPTGNLNWIRTAGGVLGDYAHAIACDGTNYVYIAGEIEGDYLDVTFVGTSTTLTCIGDNDIFFAKYDLNGNLIWAKQAGWWMNEKALGITYDASGNVYICGLFNDTTYFSGNKVIGYGSKDIYVAKYDANGNFIWVRKAGGTGRDEAKSIKCDAAGNVYVCGLFSNTATFGSQTVTSEGYFDMFLAKYDPSGNLLWLKNHGASYDDVGWSLTIDNAGQIYVAGEFNDYVYFDGTPIATTGEADVVVVCYNSSGNVQWVRKAGGDLVDRARGMGTDGVNIYITGQFGMAADFGPYTLTGADSSEIFIAALDNTGTFTWAIAAGGAPDAYEDLGNETGNAICGDASGSVYATGSLLDDGVFGGSTISSWDRTDVFITKIAQGCSSAPAQPGNISGTTAICQGTTNTYSISSVNGATSYTWTLPPGWTGTSTSTSISAAAGVSGGNITVTANNSCGSSAQKSLAVTVNPSPTTANAGPDQNICFSSATLAGNTPTTGTGTWSVISGTATITAPSSPTSGVTGIGAGTNKLRWTISSSGCPASVDSVVITRSQSPTTANAGPDQNICSSTATLAGNTPTVGTGSWSLISGTATITNPSSPASGITGIGAGTNILRWTISSSGCPVSVDSVVITRSQSPTIANAGPDQNICSSAATLSGNTPAVGTGTWSVISGTATITNPSSPASGITGIGAGTNILRWTIGSSGCPVSVDSVVITRSQSPTTANAGPDQNICSSTATLAGNTPTVGIGTWSVISGTATITAPSSPTSGVTGIGAGTNILRWTIGSSGCPVSVDSVVITRSQSPTTANAGPDQNICSSTATLAGNTPTVGTESWSLISGIATITNPSSPTSGITGIGAGTNILRWTISSSGCPASADSVIITRSEEPTVAGAGTDQATCSSTATLSANTPSIGTGAWSVISGTATITTPSSPTSGVTGLGTGTNTLRWTISNGSCTASTDEVVITKAQDVTAADAGPDQDLCTSTATLAANSPAFGTGMWTVISGTATITSPSSPASGVTGIGAGSNTLRWTISGNGCTSSTDDVVITSSQSLSTADAGPDQYICGTTATLAANAPDIGTGIWSVISGTVTIADPSSPASAVTGVGVGNNTLRWTISNTGCISSTDDVVITHSLDPTAANAGTDQSVCSPTATLAGNTPAIGSGTWTVISGAATITSPSSPTSGVTGIGVGANTLRWTISSNGCTSSTDDIIITRFQEPTTANAGTDQNICSSTTTLSGNSPANGTGNWSVISGTAAITNPSAPASGVTGLGTGANTLRWTIASSGCTSSADDVVITRSQDITAASAGPDQVICSSSATLAGNTPAVGTGNWSVVSGTATITDPSSPASGVTGISLGANTLRWTISGNGCTASEDDIIITRAQSPSVTIFSASDTICKGTNTSLRATGASTYLWSPGGMTNDTITVSPVSTTTYVVTGTDDNGCTNTDSVTVVVIICVGIEEREQEEVQIFPNPGKNEFRVTGITFPAEITVYNSIGALVSILRLENENMVLNFSSGIYFMEINSSKKVYRQKLIVRE